MYTTHQRVLGCLLGTALGDAVGLPCEGLSPERARTRRLRPRRLVSDDTEQTVVIARALARSREPEAFAGHVISGMRRWFLALPPAIGFGTLRACLRLCLGARTGVRSAGNAPAMRAAVIGVVAPDVQRLEALVARATRVTHTDPRAEDAARVVALAARSKLSLGELAAACDTRELADTIGRVARMVDAPGPELLRALGWHRGIGAYCVQTVPAALWACAQSDDPQVAIEAAIRLGGDADTTAAIAGAIAGARAPDRLPAAWLDGLGPWPAYLERLAQAVATGAPPPRRHHPLLVVPRNLAVGCVFVGYAVQRMLGW